MYRIIGGDQKEYGPIDAATLRQWQTDGRANAQTLVRPEGATDWKPLGSFPEFAAVAAPPVISNAPATSNESVSVIIPYKNPCALVAYYLGIFSFIPMIGLILGIAAFVLGIMGLKHAKANPGARGRVHAWIGIIAGGFFALVYAALTILMIIGIASHQ